MSIYTNSKRGSGDFGCLVVLLAALAALVLFIVFVIVPFDAEQKAQQKAAAEEAAREEAAKPMYIMGKNLAGEVLWTKDPNEVQSLEIGGHKYIFVRDASHGWASGMVHDESCTSPKHLHNSPEQFSFEVVTTSTVTRK